MGLDITAYRKLTKLDCVFDAGGEPIDKKTEEPMDYDFRAWVNPDFEGRADDIESKAFYSAADSFGFRAGSYSGYNGWREELSRLAGYPSVQVDRYGTGNIQERHDYGAFNADGGPFWEMINFSDCEGVIGATISAKLAKDFAEFDEKAKAFNSNGPEDWFYGKYQEWRKAFEMAADGGAVQFH